MKKPSATLVLAAGVRGAPSPSLLAEANVEAQVVARTEEQRMSALRPLSFSS
ncbi:MAG TPA: hypothetical protein VLT83_05825 [Opitutaceae bacterium]|nr:hypothetical protein [Opitutaceae bacterium]